MMVSNIRVTAVALAVLAVGCKLEDDNKTGCVVQADCLAGYQCMNNTCVMGAGGAGDAGNVSDGDDDDTIVIPDAPGGVTFYGTVEPMTAQSEGLAAANYQALVGLTSAGGLLGCAVVGDLQASPGGDAAVVYAKIEGQSGDTRCPSGVHAIMNDPSVCKPTYPDELRDGCGLYKRWNASGQQVAHQLATGGYVSVQQSVISSSAYRCSVEASIRFGTITIAKTFTFDYEPLAPTASFCQH